MTISLTVIRHGESTDNNKSVWAGHRDASLSNHGMNQADRLGIAFADIPVTAIYASDLQRATQTAQAIARHSNASPAPELHRTAILREQSFGSAEGTPWTSPFNDSASVNPTLRARRARRFPGRDGESLDDVGARAAFFVRHCILPWLHRADPSPAAGNPSSPPSASIALTASTKADSLLSNLRPVHIVVVAHGIFLSELLRHLLVLAQAPPPSRHHEPARLAGFTNTGWTRVDVGLHPGASPARPANLFSATASRPDPPHWPAPPPSFPARFAFPAISDGATPSLTTDDEEEPDPPRLVVRVLQLNQSAHLAGLKRQAGGIGSAAFDKDQKSLKAFFSGSAPPPSPASTSSQPA